MKPRFLAIPLILFLLLAVATLTVLAQSNVPAFPGCEGFGCETEGGRGGKVVSVTNLNDSGSGSLRAALMMTEPRIVIFKVSGTIYLNSQITLGAAQSFLTVAGQTAPGDGIALSLPSVNGFYLNGCHDVVIQHTRFRGGERTVMVETGSYNIVLDHNSLTWGSDQIVNTWGDNISDVTFQWNIFAEGSDQNAGSHFSGGYPHSRISVHHNYMAHTAFRNYLLDTGSYDFINNVNYNTINWDFHFRQGYHQGPGAPPVSPDVINHYFKEGPNTGRHVPFDLVQESGGYPPMSIYLSGNKYVNISGNTIYNQNDQWSMAETRSYITGNPPTYEKRQQPHTEQPRYRISTQTADAGKDLVLENAGPRIPKLDAVDSRILGDFFDNGGYNTNNIGNLPNLQTYNVPQDKDNDGMPDDWEIAHNLNPNDGTDHNKDQDGDGYTNIEEWINSIGENFSPPPPDTISPFPPQNLEVTIEE